VDFVSSIVVTLAATLLVVEAAPTRGLVRRPRTAIDLHRHRRRLRHPPLQRRRPRTSHRHRTTGLLHHRQRHHHQGRRRVPTPTHRRHHQPARATPSGRAGTKQATAAIDRYLTAFEKGTPDDEDPDIRGRLATLKNQTKKLRARKAQLEFELDQPPQPLAAADLAEIRHQIRHILANGAAHTRKAMFEALIHEITLVTDDTVRPVFKLPLTSKDERLALNGPAPTTADTANQAVRALTTMVGDTGIEPVTSSV
jgi:hypothetical protein